MASVTSKPSVVAPLAERPASHETIRIEPLRGWFDLHLKELWDYRELLYFFVWRDVKVRYKQTFVGVLWVVLQPFLTMGVFTLFFGRLAKLPSNGLPYPVYEGWLREVVNRARACSVHPEADSLVFINAWNEWGEGCHPEPCQKWGHRYLEAPRRALGTSATQAVEYVEG